MSIVFDQSNQHAYLLKNDKMQTQMPCTKFSNITENGPRYLNTIFNQPHIFPNQQKVQLYATHSSNHVPFLNASELQSPHTFKVLPMQTAPIQESMSNQNNPVIRNIVQDNEDDINRLRHNELLQLLRKSSQDIEELRKEKVESDKNTQLILEELRKCQLNILEMKSKQNDLEEKLEEVNNQKQIQNVVTKADKETMTEAIEVPQLLNRAIVNIDRPPRFILSPPTENVLSPNRLSAGNKNPNMRQLFDKYEVKGTITTKKSVDFSVSTMNYLQRYGLIDENKIGVGNN